MKGITSLNSKEKIVLWFYNNGMGGARKWGGAEWR
jgi:hypothetical protein